MIKISAVIITFNEEKNIQRCLDSLIGVADEIVVVDSFSTDQTVEICRKAGVKFIQHPFSGHIEQKNFAITQASYPHILSLDADEALTSELAASIRSAKANFAADGYQLNRLTNYCGKWIRHCGWYPDKKLRLWNSRKGHWGGVNPHDKFIMEEGSNIETLKGDLLHYSFYSIEQHVKQVNFFTEISSRALFEQGKKTSVPYIMISPIAKFIRDYILNRGFMDGYYGLVICVISSYAKFLKYAKLRSLHISEKTK